MIIIEKTSNFWYNLEICKDYYMKLKRKIIPRVGQPSRLANLPRRPTGKVVGGGVILMLMVLISSFITDAAVMHAQISDGFSDDVIKTNNYALDLPMEVKNPKEEEREKFLRNIKAELRATQKELYDVKANTVDTERKLTDVHEVITSLSGQLANLSSQMRDTENMIKNVKVQINEKENRIKLLYSDIKMKEVEILHQKTMLMEYLETLYVHENAITDTLSGGQEINIAKLLLSDKAVSEQLQEIKYLNILEQTGHELFDKLEEMVTKLEFEQAYADEQRLKLEGLNRQLEKERKNLEIQKQAKKNLLQQTRGQENIYTEMLSESREQQSEIQKDIRALREAMALIQKKMEELGDDFDPEDFEDLFTGEKISVYEFINATKDVAYVDFDWPVSNRGGISAYFRDPSYSAVFGVRHNAIDIRVPQETLIKAPADGVVYKAKDNGYGYSYLILAHEGGYMTVYGHIPTFLVEPGEKVYKGQSIALSGGTPGTKGAGLMTTGPHLHFEVMKGSSYVDPILYLPLDNLPFTLPEKYTDFVSHEPPKGKAVSFTPVN